MVLGVNAVSLRLVDDAPLVEEIISVFEGDHLLLIGRRVVHRRATFVFGLYVARITDHVVCEVVHGEERLLVRLLHGVVGNHISHRMVLLLGDTHGLAIIGILQGHIVLDCGGEV
jgi:hypothetical protein